MLIHVTRLGSQRYSDVNLENINTVHFNIVNTPYFSRAVVTVIRI